MAHDKRYVAQKRQRRRRKSVKAKMKLYEAGKLKHEQLPMLAKTFVTSVIIGAKRVDQLQQNLAAVELQLTQDEMQKLDEVSALPPEYPGWMVPFQNRNRLADVPRF